MESGNAEKSMPEQSQEFQGQNLYIWYQSENETG